MRAEPSLRLIGHVAALIPTNQSEGSKGRLSLGGVKGRRPFRGPGQSPGSRVALFMAAMFATFAIQGSYLPLWFADRGLSAASIGTVLGVASLFRVICGPSWGALADRVGARGVVLF